MKTLGASLELVEWSRVHIGVPFSPDLTQQRFIARAAVLRAGKRLSFCKGEVHTVTNSREELIATMLSTIITKTV